jgi:crossover junction endodeoxyribonuclease RuvC
VVGNGRAHKEQIHAMVIRLLDLEALPGPSDRADAIAVALCHVASVGDPRAAAGTGPARRPR